MNFTQIKYNLDKIPQYYSFLKESGKTDLPRFKWFFFIEAIANYLFYGTSFYEFAAYGFYKKSHALKRTYMTRRYMFDFFDQYNPKEYRERIGNKALTKELYSAFMQREQFEYESGKEQFYKFVEKYPRVFIKRKIGWGGEGARVETIDSQEKAAAVWETLSGDYLVEPALENHRDIKKINQEKNDIAGIWMDTQYDDFANFIESLSKSVVDALKVYEEYVMYLEEKIRELG